MATHPRSRRETAFGAGFVLAPHRALEFRAQREYFVGVIERQAPCIGEFDRPPVFPEQLFVQRFFKQLDLPAERLRRVS
ncbi:hypothetical protein P0D88_45860 [Paraburkholderia sp. RL18-103-BIB-C]